MDAKVQESIEAVSAASADAAAVAAGTATAMPIPVQISATPTTAAAVIAMAFQFFLHHLPIFLKILPPEIISINSSFYFYFLSILIR